MSLLVTGTKVFLVIFIIWFVVAALKGTQIETLLKDILAKVNKKKEEIQKKQSDNQDKV